MGYRRSILGMVLALVLLAGCGGASSAAAPVASGSETYVSPALGIGYEGALTVRNQLALGILNLEGEATEVTQEQAAALLPLWQGLRGTVRSGASATAEVDALLSQIEESLTPAQLEAIAAMQLTQERLGEWAASQGIALGTGSGAGGMGMGAGQGLSEEERATRQAANGGAGAGGSGGVSTALIDAVVSYLEKRSNA